MTTRSEGCWIIQIPRSSEWESQWSTPMIDCFDDKSFQWHLSLHIGKFKNQKQKVEFQLIFFNKTCKSNFGRVSYTILIQNFNKDVLKLFLDNEEILNENFEGNKHVCNLYGAVKDNSLSITVHMKVDLDANARIAENLIESNIATSLKQMSADLNILLNDDKHSDVVFKSSDNIEIPAHKCLLAARSSVFAAMFKHDMKENKEKFIIIDDIDSVTLKAVLEFIYTGKFDPSIHGKFEVLAAADKYDMKGLRELCETEIMKNIGINNAITALVTGDKHNLKPLKEKSCKFLARIMRYNLKSSNFQELKTKNLSLFEEVLSLAMSDDDLE